MPKPAILFLSSLTFILQTSPSFIFADDSAAPQTFFEQSSDQKQQIETPSEAPFEAFTGKVTKNKVRLRQQPTLDSPILKELNQGDLLIITGETEDFYAVQPPAGIKAYVFRAYVLDNVVEASRVNVRLEPDTEAPIIGQLGAGEKVNGTISPLNSKWLEIATPASARFYVSKDYIDKLGDPSLMAKIEKRREEVNLLLNSTYMASQTEMQKTFPEVKLDGIYANFNKIISEYKDFPEQVARAKELFTLTQEAYTQKKIAFLEAKAKMAQDDWQNKNTQLNEQLKSQQQKLSQLEQQVLNQKGARIASNQQRAPGDGINSKMAAWIPIEQAVYESWAGFNNQKGQDEFYREQQLQSISLRGIIEPYTRIIKNKPGDYILLNQSNHLPIAYLYSTHVDLQNLVGQEVTIHASPRPNNNFAFPAYFVLFVE
jgi:hypothetical protein